MGMHLKMVWYWPWFTVAHSHLKNHKVPPPPPPPTPPHPVICTPVGYVCLLAGKITAKMFMYARMEVSEYSYSCTWIWTIIPRFFFLYMQSKLSSTSEEFKSFVAGMTRRFVSAKRLIRYFSNSSKLVEHRAQSPVREVEMLAVWPSIAEGFPTASSRVYMYAFQPDRQM